MELLPLEMNRSYCCSCDKRGQALSQFGSQTWQCGHEGSVCKGVVESFSSESHWGQVSGRELPAWNFKKQLPGTVEVKPELCWKPQEVEDAKAVGCLQSRVADWE